MRKSLMLRGFGWGGLINGRSNGGGNPVSGKLWEREEASMHSKEREVKSSLVTALVANYVPQKLLCVCVPNGYIQNHRPPIESLIRSGDKSNQVTRLNGAKNA